LSTSSWPRWAASEPRTQALARELTVLLDVSLDSAAPGSPAKE
jgi:hypothetical protein